MSKVSTRPRKDATTVAKTATVVTFSATPVAAPASVEEHVAAAVYSKVAELLDEASAEEGDHVHSGESERLLRMGATLARKFALGDRSHEESAENFAYDIAALVRASRLVPGDCESEARAALIAQCEPLLASLVDANSDPLFEPLAPRPVLVKRLTMHSPLHLCGDAAQDLIKQASYDIEAMARMLLERFDDEDHDAAVVRALVGRIKQVNAVTLSYFGDDDLYTLGTAFQEVWQGSRDLDEVLQ